MYVLQLFRTTYFDDAFNISSSYFYTQMPPHRTMISVPSNRILYVAEENFEAVKPMSPIEYPNHVCIQYSYKIKFLPVDEHDELFRLSWMIIMHSLCKKWCANARSCRDDSMADHQLFVLLVESRDPQM